MKASPQPEPLTREEFRRWFARCRTAFRIETLQVYRVPDEEPHLRAFQAGQPLPPSPWAAMVRDSSAAFQRVHLVREPLTDYLRYEMRGYRDSVEAGEDVRIVVLDQHPDLAPLITHDWWGFDLDTDQPAVVLMRYDDAGHWLGNDLVTDPAALPVYRELRSLALARSMPLSHYRTLTDA